MLFTDLTRFFEKLEATRSRNAMTELLAVLLARAADDEIKEVSYLAEGGLGPAYNRVEFQLAEKMVVRALAQRAALTPTKVWQWYKQTGDLGLVALRQAQGKPGQRENLFVVEVYKRLLSIAQESGIGSQDQKVQRLAALLSAVGAIEAKYVVRIVMGRLRLGFSDKTLLDALAVMATGSKAGRAELEAAYQVYPDIGQIGQWVKADGIKALKRRVRVTLGVPVMSALCQRLKSAEEMIQKMGTVMVEPKFDGTRVQIHIRRQATGDKRQAWRVKTYTRNLEETTWMFPELEEVVEKIKAEAVIIDSEAVGFNLESGRLLPFQETITRKRKHEVAATRGKVPLRFFAFDLLYLNGQSWLKRPLKERRQQLLKIIGANQMLVVDEAIQTNDPKVLREYHAQQLKQGYEGVVVKKVEGEYEPGRRGFNWVKFKEVETAAGKLADTIDGVVMGFYRGRGKRTQFGIGAFLVGVRDEAGKVIKTIAKIGTGLTDEQWRELKRRLDEQVNATQPTTYVVAKNLIPDVWTDPQVVVEIAADEVTRSPVHSAGYALRFPRLVRFRDDKAVDQATSLKELLSLR